MAEEKEIMDLVDWKGFTEEDFEKFKEWDGKSKADFSRQFFAGNMCMKIPDSEELSTGERAYRDVDFVVLRPEGPSTFDTMHFHSEFDLPALNYDDFKGKINETLTYLVNNCHMDEILDARPDKWAAGYCDELTADAKQFLNEGKSFEAFEKEVIKKNPRLNASLFGSSKELAKKIRKNLEKDKEMKAFLEKPGNSR